MPTTRKTRGECPLWVEAGLSFDATIGDVCLAGFGFHIGHFNPYGAPSPWRDHLTNDKTDLLDMTVGIVSNYVSNHRVSPEELAGLISSVHGALGNVGQAIEEETSEPERLTPAAIRKLITPDGVRSLIDGRVFKSMKRHLTINGMTPQEYRAKYGLPADFPMVSANYAAQRSAMAKAIGLGSGGRKPKGPIKAARKPRAAKA